MNWHAQDTLYSFKNMANCWTLIRRSVSLNSYGLFQPRGPNFLLSWTIPWKKHSPNRSFFQAYWKSQNYGLNSNTVQSFVMHSFLNILKHSKTFENLFYCKNIEFQLMSCQIWSWKVHPINSGDIVSMYGKGDNLNVQYANNAWQQRYYRIWQVPEASCLMSLPVSSR